MNDAPVKTSAVKRYDMAARNGSLTSWVEACECVSGKYVTFADYSAMEARALARDAERYRWLKTRISREDATETSGDLSMTFQRWYHIDYTKVLDSDHIDDYIDRNIAALAHPSGAKEGEGK